MFRTCFIASWPFLTMSAFAFPFGEWVALALMFGAFYALWAHQLMPVRQKVTLASLWGVVVLLVFYSHLAFDASVRAAETQSPTPIWAQGAHVAVLGAFVVCIIAALKSAVPGAPCGPTGCSTNLD